jgi:hypothetical protein
MIFHKTLRLKNKFLEVPFRKEIDDETERSENIRRPSQKIGTAKEKTITNDIFRDSQLE